MRGAATLLLGGALAGALLAGGSPARAAESQFAFVYTTDLLPKGEKDFEQWITLKEQKNHGEFHLLEGKTEFEYGVSDDFQLAFYVNYASVYAKKNGPYRQTTAPEPFAGFQIVYFGTFDWRGERSPETFLRAFAQFLQRHPEARPKSKFLFYGNWLPEHNRFIEELKLADVVSLLASVPYEQYLQKLQASPVLLLVVSSAHNFFMPSKIVDYFGARRPILAFVPRQSEMRRVLETAGMAEFAADESDPGAGAAALEKLWTLHRSGNLQVNADKTYFWSSAVQVPKYVELVRAGAVS